MNHETKSVVWYIAIGFIVGIALMVAINQQILTIMQMWFTW